MTPEGETKPPGADAAAGLENPEQTPNVEQPAAQPPVWRKPEDSEWEPLTPETNAATRKLESKPRDDLKNMLLGSLQMQNVVVLAGCGCSRSAGGPSMQNLWECAVGLVPSEKTMKMAKKVGHDIEDKNVEGLLSRVEAFLQISDDADVREFLNQSKKAILDRCSAFLDSAELGPHRTFLHRMARRRVRDERLRIFTTNYDLCFERAARDVGELAIDGFSFSAPRQYDPRFFAYDIVRRLCGGNSPEHYLEGVFLLYKLHGSVNWARDKQGVIREKEHPEPEEACLVYPASGKYQQSFVQPYLESVAQYLGALREPNTCLLTVGFGFNDAHLAEPLLAAAQTNPHLRLIVVDLHAKDKMEGPKPNSYCAKLLDLSKSGEDIWLINAGFEEFAKLIPDLKSLTPAESLLKAVQGVAKVQ